MVNAADILSARILVVDDSEVNVRLIEGVLRVAGYTAVDSTKDPRAVCELYRRNRYDAILLDLQMPGMDGFEVMEGLKEIEFEGYLPVLVITAQPGHKLRALEAGARDFVGKPFEMAELRARVRNLLEVRLLHRRMKIYSGMLEETVRDLEASREVLRLKTIEEEERREEELALAQETQESLLPRCLPRLENYLLDAFSTPTLYVGGDFYDFQQLKTGEWAGVLGDVSGKGMPAALLSSMVLGALSMELRSETPADEVLNRINRLLCEKSLPYQFVTLFLFLLGPSGEGRFISAGQNPACLYRAATGKIEQLYPEHYALGMFDFAVYESRQFRMDEGDVLVVYSDGLTDAQNPKEEMFGLPRLLNIVRQAAPRGSAAVRQEARRAIDEFTGGMAQTDDITLVVVEKQRAA